MNNPPPFELLHLPSLACRHILQISNVREQFRTATLSKRMKFLVRSAYGKRHVNATVQFGTHTSFILENKTMKKRFTFIMSPVIPLVYPELKTIKQQIRFMKEVFNLQSFSAKFLLSYPVGLEFIIISFLKQENLKIGEIEVESSEAPNGVDDYVMNECRDAQSLALKYRSTLIKCPVLNVESITLWHAKWVTIDHLLDCFMNCERVFLPSRRFTAEEVNKFIKRWIEGSKIEDFWFQLKGTFSQFSRFFYGIDVTPVGQAYVYSVWRETKEFGPGHCFMVKQTSGVEAIVYFDPDWGWNITTYFTMDIPIPRTASDYQRWESDHEKDFEDDDLKNQELSSASSASENSSDESPESEEDNSSEHSADEEEAREVEQISDISTDTRYGLNGETSSDDREEEDSSDGSTDTEYDVPYMNFDNKDSNAEDEASGDEIDNLDRTENDEEEDKDIVFSEEEDNSSDALTEAEDEVPYASFKNDDSDADDEQSDTEDN